MSIEKPIITAVPAKVPAILIFEKKGPFKAGDKFDVTATAGLLFKGQRFGRISNGWAFKLQRALVGTKEQSACGIQMSELVGPMGEVAWPTCMHPEKVVVSIEALADADEFSCEMEGLTVRSAGDAKAHDYDREPINVTIGVVPEHN